MTIKEKIAKLIDLRSIVTMVITGGITYGFFSGKITGEQYLVLATMIYMFYFQKEKKVNGE